MRRARADTPPGTAAVLESRGEGLPPDCITIDDQTMDYPPCMFGPAAFAIVDELCDRPVKGASIRRRIAP